MPSYVRSGAALSVNSLTSATQMRSSITALGDGGFIVVWQSSDPNADGSGYAVRAQRYNSQGVAVGSETLINASTAGDQGWPTIASLASGGYVVTWETSDPTQDGSGFAVKARLFDSSGVPVGGEFRVNSQTAADQKQPNVVGLSDGGFLIAWQTSDTLQDGSGGAVKAQRFDSAGVAVGGEFLINNLTAGTQSVVDIAALANGGFVATWQSGSGGAGTQVKGQIFGADGTRIGSEFNASDGTGTHTSGRVAALPDGGFVLTWRSSGVSKAQFFDSSGNKTGAQLTIGGSDPEVAVRSDGTLLFTWWDSSGNIKAQVYDGAGQVLGPQTLVFQGGSANGLASMQSVAMLANGNVVLAFDHVMSGTGDLNIKLQMLRPNTGLDIGAATRSVSVAENGFASQVLATVAPVDSPGMTVAYSIVGGADAARFTLDSSGQLRLTSSPNYEAPTDSNGDNVYEVIVRASDGEYSDDQTISVAVTNVNESPTIVSNGGGFSAAVTVAENQNSVTTVAATDPEGSALTYSIVSGADRSRFTINAATGVLTFISAPNFEARVDADANNVYEVTVAVTDGVKSDTQALSITVANVNEAPLISGSQTNYFHNENDIAVGTLAASDGDGDALTWSIAGGADAALFAIDPVTGALRFVAGPNFEAPGDAGADNVYDVIVAAGDGSLAATRALTVEVLNRGEGPVIVSGGGGDTASVSVAENVGFVTAIVADDPDMYDSPYSFWVVGGADAALFTINGETGQLFFKSGSGGDFEAPADADGDNVYEVTVSVRSGLDEPADTQALSVTVTDGNDAPVITSGGGGASASVSTPENQLAATLVTASDLENGPLTYAISGGADAALFTIDGASGLLSFRSAPDREAPGDSGANNIYNVIVSVSDGDRSDSQALSITILDSNEGPVITSNGGGSAAAVAVAENGLAVTTVASTDPEGQLLSYSISGGADASRFAIDASTGALSFLAAPDHEQPADSDGDNLYEVVVSASDGVSSAAQALSVAVGNVDEGVAITSGGASSVAENGAAVMTVTAVDLDGGSVSFAISGGADASLFAIDSATGALSFAGAPNFEAPADADGDNVYDVVVSASDGTFADARAVAVTVTDVNEAIAFVSGGGGGLAEVSVAENSGNVFALEAVDPDGTTPFYGIAGGADAALFRLDPVTHMLQFASLPDFEAPGDFDGDNVYEVIVGASDGQSSDFQTIRVTVGNVYEGVRFDPSVQAFSVNENDSAVATLSASGESGASFHYSLGGGADAALFAIDAAGNLSFVGAPDFESAGDSDGDNVYTFVVSATDGISIAYKSVTVAVGNVDEPVELLSYGGAANVALDLVENGFAVGIVQARDEEDMSVTYSITGGADAESFQIDALTGALSFREPNAPDFEDPTDFDSDNVHEVVVTASSSTSSATQAFAISIVNGNDAPWIASGLDLSVDEGDREIAAIDARDVDGDAVTYAIVGGADAASFAIDSATGLLTFIDSPDYELPLSAAGTNVYTVEIEAGDGQATSRETFQVTVGNVDEPVEILSYGGAASVALTVEEHSLSLGQVAARDEEDWLLTYSITGGADAARFEVDPNTGALAFLYPLMPDFEAPADADGDNVYDVVVTASSSTSSADQAFAITVTDRNEGLWITSDGHGDAYLSVDEGARAVTTVTAFDPDGDVPAFSILGGADAASFAIDAATGALTFVAAPDHEAPGSAAGTNFYIVEVGAGDGEFTARQKIQVEVRNVNEGVTITSGGGGSSSAATVGENGLAVAAIAASDADGDALTYSIAGGADSARFAIDAQTGALRFVQAPNFESPTDSGGDNVYDVVVSVTDGTFTDSQTIAVTVANLNEAVAITSNGGGAGAAIAVAENGTAVATVTAGDPDGGPISYTIAGGADAERFTIDSSTGALAFVSAPNFEAPADSGGNNVYDVVVSASDGTFTDTQALAVTVGNVNEGVAITSGGGAASVSIGKAENSTAVTTVSASDADGGAVSYAIAGGADSARFRIDPATGALVFVSAPDFESPSDSGGDNVYEVIVSASDGAFTDTQTIAVQVGNVNEAVTITSNGGGSAAAVSVVENSAGVTVVNAADPDGAAPTYSIVGGADASRFAINAQTGVLQFVAAPDHELPGDSNGDNVYSVIVRASDGQFVDDQALNVTVANARDGNNVTGTSGSDSISATSLSVSLRTSNEEDTVFGRDGHDNIQGMAGDDELHGEGGNDTLVGGAGADRLTGGLGKDTFTYNGVSESSGALRDLILDFSRAQGDKISLSAIDANANVSTNQAFTFIGSAAFSNVAGQLRYETSGGITTISGDVNGDGIADLQIQLQGTISLIASDFIL